MNSFQALLLGSAAILMSALPAQADNRVVASIKPVHSLVAGVMQGIGTPGLIVDGGASPHTYSLRPSKARALERATLIFWVGPNMETFLEKPIGTLGEDAAVIELMDAPGLTRVGFREGGPFGEHAHDEHDRDDHDRDDHDRDDHDRDDHDRDDHDRDGHAEGAFDAHIWLDPENAGIMVREIAAALATADPGNAAHYRANADALDARIDGLSVELRKILEPVRERPFFVFHDAYQYMERRFGLTAAGSITVRPDSIPGAERVAEIRDRIRRTGVTCVFSEPQFAPKLIGVVTEGTLARTGTLDPIGTRLSEGADLYFALMRNMATAMRDCLML